MGCLSVRSKYIYQDGHKFLARGVSYGPFALNSRGESYPEPDRVASDFALMQKLGANLVRTYVTPPSWMFELAAKHELLLMPGISWPQHLTFLDSPEMARDIRNTVRREMAALGQFKERVFAYSIGNEIRSDIVRWHGPRRVSRFLAELYDIGKQFDPTGLFTYSNYPSAEYLDLSFLDVISFNVYLHRETDFRRYLTHLMAITGERPLVLSEIGIDSIREGEQNQADLLSWQSRAAFELGVSGLVIFAFTDEWFRGGSEIVDWAFGITSRERSPKLSYAAISGIFRGSLPPPLAEAPRASVIVAAYNAAPTIARCLDSLKRLNYPDYEIIVVDDGSTDSTAAIAEAAGVQTFRVPHGGLAAARNAGLAEARGRIVAFIDADAVAECEWLYHLAEVIIRRNAAAAGGQNFAPEQTTMLASIVAVAPGQAQEVRSGNEDLAQLCGCNMALDKIALAARVFDCAFKGAGEDVDLSWRLRDMQKTLAYAPGAIVLHERRTAIGAYLKQQRGYGHAEGLLFRKYPDRRDRVYDDSGWFADWFGGGSRIYYGEFGHGLFQTIYPRSSYPSASLFPLTFQWVGASVLLALAGILDKTFGILGAAGLCATLVCAVAGAVQSAGKLRSSAGLFVLIVLWVLGPVLRSRERDLVKWRFAPDASGPVTSTTRRLRGTIPLEGGWPDWAQRDRAVQDKFQLMTEILHAALVRRGLAVAKGTRYDAFDLRIIVAPFVRVAVFFVHTGNTVSLGWRIGAAGWRIGASLAILIAMLLVGDFSLTFVLATCALVTAAFAALALSRSWRVPAIISAASVELTARSETAAGAAQARPLIPGAIPGPVS
jgi:glycosyltransferase involved in cell wall biosynthesis